MRRWPLVGGAAAIAAVGAAIACSDTNVRILTGQLYDPQGMCLGPSSGVDVLAGGGGGDHCAPECLLANLGDAQAAYISQTCPPYSPDYATENTDQARDASDPCFGAFAAYEAGVLCSPDGGAPEAATDASPDAAADAGADGATGTMDAASDGAAGDAAQDAAGE